MRIAKSKRNSIFLKDPVADYANTPEVTFSISNSRKLYEDTR